MNILFFLTPKSEIAFINEQDTIRQAMEKMEIHRFTVVPLIARTGTYIGTITEGDLLWEVKNNHSLSLKDAEAISIMNINRRVNYQPVKADAKMEDLIERVLNQNFVPVVDDRDSLIGIVTRKDVIRYLCKKQDMNLSVK